MNLYITQIARYCASSTECSDHSFKKIQQFFFKLLSFFFRRRAGLGIHGTKKTGVQTGY